MSGSCCIGYYSYVIIQEPGNLRPRQGRKTCIVDLQRVILDFEDAKNLQLKLLSDIMELTYLARFVYIQFYVSHYCMQMQDAAANDGLLFD